MRITVHIFISTYKSMIFFPGIFRERQRIEPEYAWSARSNLEQRAIILVGVFNLDPGYAYGLEQSWRDITG